MSGERSYLQHPRQPSRLFAALLIVQGHIGQQFCSHGKPIVVIVNESHGSEFVHEEGDASSRSAYHFGEDLVTDGGDFAIGHYMKLADTSELKENPGQPLLAVIEKLIAQIFLQIGVAH